MNHRYIARVRSTETITQDILCQRESNYKYHVKVQIMYISSSNFITKRTVQNIAANDRVHLPIYHTMTHRKIDLRWFAAKTFINSI